MFVVHHKPEVFWSDEAKNVLFGLITQTKTAHNHEHIIWRSTVVAAYDHDDAFLQQGQVEARHNWWDTGEGDLVRKLRLQNKSYCTVALTVQ